MPPWPDFTASSSGVQYHSSTLILSTQGLETVAELQIMTSKGIRSSSNCLVYSQHEGVPTALLRVPQALCTPEPRLWQGGKLWLRGQKGGHQRSHLKPFDPKILMQVIFLFISYIFKSRGLHCVLFGSPWSDRVCFRAQCRAGDWQGRFRLLSELSAGSGSQLHPCGSIPVLILPSPPQSSPRKPFLPYTHSSFYKTSCASFSIILT